MEGAPRRSASGGRSDEFIFANQGVLETAPTESEKDALSSAEKLNEVAIAPLMEQRLKVEKEMDELAENDPRFELLNARQKKINELLAPLLTERKRINNALADTEGLAS